MSDDHSTIPDDRASAGLLFRRVIYFRSKCNLLGAEIERLTENGTADLKADLEYKEADNARLRAQVEDTFNAAWRREHELLSRAEAAEAENARLRAQVEDYEAALRTIDRNYGHEFAWHVAHGALSDEGKPDD